MTGRVVALLLMLSVGAASAATAGFTLALVTEKLAGLPVCVSETLMSMREYDSLRGAEAHRKEREQ